MHGTRAQRSWTTKCSTCVGSTNARPTRVHTHFITIGREREGACMHSASQHVHTGTLCVSLSCGECTLRQSAGKVLADVRYNSATCTLHNVQGAAEVVCDLQDRVSRGVLCHGAIPGRGSVHHNQIDGACKRPHVRSERACARAVCVQSARTRQCAQSPMIFHTADAILLPLGGHPHGSSASQQRRAHC